MHLKLFAKGERREFNEVYSFSTVILDYFVRDRQRLQSPVDER